VSSWKEDPTNKVWEAEIDKYIDRIHFLSTRCDELEDEKIELLKALTRVVADNAFKQLASSVQRQVIECFAAMEKK
jgi:predicted YcjX-like family ATPase